MACSRSTLSPRAPELCARIRRARAPLLYLSPAAPLSPSSYFSLCSRKTQEHRTLASSSPPIAVVLSCPGQIAAREGCAPSSSTSSPTRACWEPLHRRESEFFCSSSSGLRRQWPLPPSSSSLADLPIVFMVSRRMLQPLFPSSRALNCRHGRRR